MTPEEIEELVKRHKDAFAWMKEEREHNNRVEAMDDFIELHELPKDITIGELLDFCRKRAE